MCAIPRSTLFCKFLGSFNRLVFAEVFVSVSSSLTKIANDGPIVLGENVLEEVENFTYLGSIVNNLGGTDSDVKARIGKARVAFLQLKKNGAPGQ